MQTPKIHSHKKIYIILSIFIGIILLAVGSWMIHTATTTYPLGDKLDYIGKKQSGCYISLTICDSVPSTAYYYATNLNRQELTEYFKKVSDVEVQTSAVTTSTGYTYDYITFHVATTPDVIDLSYYENSDSIIHDMKLKKSTKEHVVSLNSKYYQALHDSL